MYKYKVKGNTQAMNHSNMFPKLYAIHFALALFNSNVRKRIDRCPKMQESKYYLAFTKQQVTVD